MKQLIDAIPGIVAGVTMIAFGYLLSRLTKAAPRTGRLPSPSALEWLERHGFELVETPQTEWRSHSPSLWFGFERPSEPRSPYRLAALRHGLGMAPWPGLSVTVCPANSPLATSHGAVPLDDAAQGCIARAVVRVPGPGMTQPANEAQQAIARAIAMAFAGDLVSHGIAGFSVSGAREHTSEHEYLTVFVEQHDSADAEMLERALKFLLLVEKGLAAAITSRA